MTAYILSLDLIKNGITNIIRNANIPTKIDILLRIFRFNTYQLI